MIRNKCIKKKLATKILSEPVFALRTVMQSLLNRLCGWQTIAQRGRVLSANVAS